ncbi:MAG: hypothetical protein ACWA7D_17955, partial [Pseudomonas asiatica]
MSGHDQPKRPVTVLRNPQASSLAPFMQRGTTSPRTSKLKAHNPATQLSGKIDHLFQLFLP